MKIDDYLKEKEIHPSELREKFNLVKTFQLDIFGHKGCFNCGDLHNNHRLPAGSWNHAQHCWVCDSINFVYESDRMGGNYTDTIEVYQEK